MTPEPSLPRARLDAEKVHFWRHGYIKIEGMFTAAEMRVVRRCIEGIDRMNRRVEQVRAAQAEGAHPSFETVVVWNDVTADDLFSKVGRSYKILDRLAHYYEDDVYDYHNKIALKYPGVVGFRPHQDHAYWREYGCRLPEAHAAFIAIDDATRDNGCLCVVPDSHLLGTLPHTAWTARGSDHGVDPAVLDELLAIGYRLEPIEMASGDVVLFHGNTIHGSADNHSEAPRLAMIATMNTRRNSPDPALNRSGHPYYSKQARVYDAIVEDDLKRPLPDFDLRY